MGVDDLVQGLGLDGMSKSQVSRICREVDSVWGTSAASAAASSCSDVAASFMTATNVNGSPDCTSVGTTQLGALEQLEVNKL